MKSMAFLITLAVIFSGAIAADQPNATGSTPQGGTGGKPADMTKPVKVFIMLGQSNMVGMGAITRGSEHPLEKVVKEEKLYPFLLDDAGNWVERKDVRNVFLLFDYFQTTVLHNEWLRVGAGDAYRQMNAHMGIEYGVGHLLGNAYEDPIMLLKCSNGNRSLGYDLLPPGSKGHDFVVTEKAGKNVKETKDVTYTYAGYKETPVRWVKGTTPAPEKGKMEKAYGGWQYDGDIGNAKKVLAELPTYYPGAKGYEVAGFFFWQGEKDCGDPALSAHYEENLVNLIKQLRKEFNAPDAKFVVATLGEADKGIGGNEEKVLEAHLAVDGNSGKHPEFKGNVATVITHPMARGGSGNAHYGKDSRVYMDVGLAMGEAMLKLLKGNSN